MIKDHLEQLRSRLDQADGLPPATKTELLKLIAAVETEVGLETSPAAETQTDSANTSTETEPGINRLMASVEELEASHPDLAASINQVALTLSKMGI